MIVLTKIDDILPVAPINFLRWVYITGQKLN